MATSNSSRHWTGACLALVLVVLVGSLLAPLVGQEGWRSLAQAWRALVWRPLLAALLALLPGLALGLAAGVPARRQVAGAGTASPVRSPAHGVLRTLGAGTASPVWWGGLASEVVLLPAGVVAAVPALALLLTLQSATSLRLELLLALALWPRCARVARALVADGLHLRQVALVAFATTTGAGTLWFAALQFLGRTGSPPLVTVATSPLVLASAAPLLLLACVPWLLLAAALSRRGQEVAAEVYR